MVMRGPLRQSQVIRPFGPGAMHTDRFGISLICCGLDHWYSETEYKDLHEFIIDDEWRIQRDLRINHLRLPPDYRRSRTGIEVPNIGLTIPFLRFPTWHYCSICGRMEKTTLTYQGTGSQKICIDCEKKKSIKNPLVQVRFVAVCDHGHIMEFPWKEWAHQSHAPTCSDSALKLVEYGGGTLDGIEISCSECGKHKRLGGITSHNLSVDREEFVCSGQRLWVHDEIGSGCGRPIRGSLRNASNIYFSQVFSSIFLPRHSAPAASVSITTADIIQVLEKPAISARIDTALELGVGADQILDQLKKKHALDLQEYTDDEIKVALDQYITAESEIESVEQVDPPEPFSRESFRFEEYQILNEEWNEPYLLSKEADLKSYSSEIQKCFSKIMLINKLRETRVFTGFTRLNAISDQSRTELQNQLWLNPPNPGVNWLPANIVHGEGIFFEFDRKSLVAWLQKQGGRNAIDRIDRLEDNYNSAIGENHRFFINHQIHPILVLIHTFSHLLINQLTFECGYSSASLCERLYFSNNEENLMSGVLIYTAAGDSEGTMGGLVRMGQPTMLEPLLTRTIQKAQWCSADPVCMELGNYGGQGTFSCNLAACHNCALVPETACEEFNRFLDRGVVTGTVENRELGFFSSFI